MLPEVSRETQALQTLIGALGKDTFASAFVAECAQLSGADQIALFGIRGGSAECLLAERPANKNQASVLCRRYIQQFIGRDSFLAASLHGCPPFATAVVARADISDTVYRRTLFEDAGLEGKIAALSCGAEGHFYLNLYYGDLGSAAFRRGLMSVQSVGSLLLELLRKHHCLIGSARATVDGRASAEGYLRERFHLLSAREVQVCAGILCGHRVDRIATRLGVSVATVKTFRTRAYAKLSISSQNELFARCAGLLM